MQQKLYVLSFGFVALILAMQNAHAAAQYCGACDQIVPHSGSRDRETRPLPGIAPRIGPTLPCGHALP
ncbi:MAG: hypothetical protein PHX82_04355 [Paracoccaceae bacterium]|nr:hypothetical protein [Paracoccaceae bacterium]